MKTCPKCSTTHEKPGTFCSRTCANSRVVTAEANERRTKALRAYYAGLSTNEVAQRHGRGIVAAQAARRANAAKRRQEANTEELGHEGRRRKIFAEQDGKCNCCGISEWQGRPLVLELEHKDGNRKNNVRDNLEMLCPNCHSQTDTWRGRNNQRK